MSVAIVASLLCVIITTGFTRSAFNNPDDCDPDEGAAKVITFLDFVGAIVKDANELVEKGKKNENREDRPMDCTELKESGAESGIHRIWPRNRVVDNPVDVFCDMDDDGGGWTVIQRRGDFNSSKDYFYRDWNSYKTGFGDLNKDFWIGNDVIFALTNQRACSIKFVLRDWLGETAYATYDNFWINDEDSNYTMHVNGYRGTAGDSFKRQNGKPFGTKDKHTDENPSNCAVDFKGAWWYEKCHDSNLNGLYLRGSHESFANGVNWRAFKDYHYSLKDTFMKIRQRNMK